MSSRNSPIIVALLLVLGGFFALTPPARAQQASQEIGKALDQAADKTADALRVNIDEVKKAIDAGVEKQKDTMITLEKERIRDEATPAIDYDLFYSLVGIPQATATTSMLMSTLLDSRYRELELMKMATGTLARGLVDSTSGSLANDPANFKVYMQYFCDPLAQNGDMATVDTGAGKCGAARIAALGDPGPNPYANTDVARKNLQITGLPLKPSLLFFEPITYPSSAGNIGDPAQPNVNPMADLYYGAYHYFERLVLGKPSILTIQPDIKTGTGIEPYLTNQGKIARQTLASVPFAMLASERIGTLINAPAVKGEEGSTSPAAAAAMLLGSGYASATTDPAVNALLTQLQTQPTMSVAQYLDIVAYRLPMSPGYLTRIQSLSPTQLMREKLFLMGIQNVLKYKINRWMEVSVALEAVGK